MDARDKFIRPTPV